MRLKTMRKRFFAILCTASLVFATADIEASASVISPTDVAVASSGNVLIGVDGTFMTADLQAGINRINEIRREAYEEKIVSAYVPVKLSAELEGIAKIRAAEAALEIGHTRPNGTRGMLTTYQGMRSYGEILAWNFRGGLVGGINQWYEEKEDLINETGGETGHYTQMIDPKNEYIGLGCFYCTSGVPYPYSICGEFNSYTSSHTDVTDRLEPSYDTTQLIEVPEGNVTVP
ncbi:MAG: CAP domain-containing protein, partial [Lachnospiraceae bacterium]|nr:CAP domain-containing protein [Lachnospiraceae bacterium]